MKYPGDIDLTFYAGHVEEHTDALHEYDRVSAWHATFNVALARTPRDVGVGYAIALATETADAVHGKL